MMRLMFATTRFIALLKDVKPDTPESEPILRVDLKASA
jgi:hypothetical protein